jgi:uncharacterized membrane protein
VFYRPFAPPLLLLLLLLLGLLVAFVELRVLAYAYRKVGVRPRYVFAVLLLSLAGSHVNIPLYSVRTERLVPPREVHWFGRTYIVPGTIRQGSTVVAANVGGAVIPVAVSLYLIRRTRLYLQMAIGVIVNGLAHVVPGVGIAVPMFVPPLAAAGAALIVAFRRAPPVAYVAGSMGALIGADLMVSHGSASWAPRLSPSGARGRSTGCSSRASSPVCSCSRGSLRLSPASRRVTGGSKGGSRRRRRPDCQPGSVGDHARFPRPRRQSGGRGAARASAGVRCARGRACAAYGRHETSRAT